MHSFLCAMLFGMEKGRGRSSVTDAYSQYEPWHAPSFYAGALKFTVGQQKFYLERNFYSKEKTDYLRNELDGEELSVGFGDLTMLLGGVSKDSYARTYDITQAGAATGNQMVKILAEYLAQASDGSDSGVTVAEAAASLNARKRELQQERRRADEEREARLKELQLEKNLLEQECEGIRASIEKYEAHYADDESGMHAKYYEQTGSTEDWQPEKTGYILSFFAILIAILLFNFKVYITPALFWTGELAALAIALFSAIRQYKKNQNRARLQAASMQAEQLRKLREREVMVHRCSKRNGWQTRCLLSGRILCGKRKTVFLIWRKRSQDRVCRAGQSTKERKIFRHWSLRRRRSQGFPNLFMRICRMN